MSTSTEVLRDGFAALKQAVADLGVSVTDPALYWLLGQGYLESGLGYGDMSHMPSAKHFANTNNVGAVYWPSDSNPPNPYTDRWVPGRDVQPGGQTFVPKIAAYPTLVDGFKGFLTVFQRYGRDALDPIRTSGATPSDLARGLYLHGYFGGCHVGLDGEKSLNRGQVFLSQAKALQAKIQADPAVVVSCAGKRPGSTLLHDTQAAADEANIAEYAQMIANGANMARKALGQPAQPVPEIPKPPPQIQPLPPTSPSVPAPLASAGVSTALALAGLGGVGALGYYIYSRFFP